MSAIVPNHLEHLGKDYAFELGRVCLGHHIYPRSCEFPCDIIWGVLDMVNLADPCLIIDKIGDVPHCDTIGGVDF
jgi:hypothetical protein